MPPLLFLSGWGSIHSHRNALLLGGVEGPADLPIQVLTLNACSKAVMIYTEMSMIYSPGCKCNQHALP